jgi:hypothetical protein
MQSISMESNWAAENLQTIRTLMERSAVYRRALAPIATFVGSVGTIAGINGCFLKSERPVNFLIYWMSVSLGVLTGAFVRARFQAVKDAEPFWSPPTRRVAQAMLPALLIGLVFGLISAIRLNRDPTALPVVFLVPIWALLYGLALNAAGFFMPRGIKMFGWGFIIAGLVMLVMFALYPARVYSPHLLMGLVFGLSHLAYGIYLYFTESRKNEA